MSVVSISERDHKKWCYLDDGIYGLFFHEFVKLNTHQIIAPYSTGEDEQVCLTGPTCDGTDII